MFPRGHYFYCSSACTYPSRCYCHVSRESCCSCWSWSSSWPGWRSAWSYLTKSGSTAYHRCAASGENEPGGGSAATRGARRDCSRTTGAAPAVEVAVESARSTAVGGDDGDATEAGARDAEAKRTEAIAMRWIGATQRNDRVARREGRGANGPLPICPGE